MTTSSSRLEQLKAALRGRYDIDRPVGEGGMAVVWLAQDVKHDRRVAVKILRRELGLSLGAERFAREIAIAARLNHPNIVGVIDSGVVELGDVQLPYYVMPLVEGPSLRDLLEREGPMSVDEALRLAAEVADALDFAHARGVVHRDVKPGNILIQAGHALVADFGIARAIDAAGRAGAATTESLVGTPIYMSPEQCRGEERVDGRSDIYSLGCVLYEMLGGAPPFEAPTPQAVSLAHCNTPVPPLEGRRPGLPVSVQKVVLQMLAKSPADRFATAGEVRRELERVRTRTSAPTQAITPVGRRSRWWLGAAAVAVLAGLLTWRAVSREAATETSVGDAVVVLGGFRDRSGVLADDAARLNDLLREELRTARGLRVIDAAEQPDLPADSLRRRFGADWIVRGTLDRTDDSVGITVRVLEARSGAELGGGSAWRVDAATLRAAASSLEGTSPFGVVRRTLASQLEERRLLRLEADPLVLALRQRSREQQRDFERTYYDLGPTRALEQLAVADSLLAEAERRNPRGVLATLERARLTTVMMAVAEAGRQRFTDSASALPEPAGILRRGIGLADAVVQRAPSLPDGWIVRAELKTALLLEDSSSTSVPDVIADYREANKLDPNRADAWLAQSSLETRLGDQRAALFSVRKAIDADRLHVRGAYLDYKLFEAELAMERFDSAAAACATGRARYPAYAGLAMCESELAGVRSRRPADAARALALADSLAALDRPEPGDAAIRQLRFLAAAILWRAGLADSGERVYRLATAPWGETIDPHDLGFAAYARSVRGDADSALALVARAVRQDPSLAPYFMRAARFAPLRREPGFERALQGIPPYEALGRSPR